MIVNDLENKKRADEFNSHPRYIYNLLTFSELWLAGVDRSGQQRVRTLLDVTLFSSPRQRK